MPGTLAFATDTDKLRVQTSIGWQNVQAVNVLADLNPASWWPAATATTTSIPNAIAGQPSFTGTATAIGVDSAGVSYIQFNGTTNFFTAGTTSSFRYLHDGRPFTLAMVVDFVTLPGIRADVLGTANQTAQVGFQFRWDFTSAVQQGMRYYTANGTSGQVVLNARDRYPIVGKQIYIARSNGYSQSITDANAVSAATSLLLRRSGTLVATGAGNPAAVPTALSVQTAVLTLGRNPGGASDYASMRLYELMVDSKCWTDYQVQQYEQYAKLVYAA